MSKEEEESVFEAINSTLSEIKEHLATTNEALVVIALELYEAKREFTDILKKINTTLGKLAEIEEKPWKEEVSAVQEPERYQELVFPKSTLPKAEEATE